MGKYIQCCILSVTISLLLCSCAPTRPARIVEMQPEIEDEPVSLTQQRANLAHVASTADIQSALAANGIAITADGKMGPQTKTALRTFQQKNGLKVTGIADPATLTKLGL